MSTNNAEKQKEYQAKYKQKEGVKEKYATLNKNWIEKNRTRYNQAKAEYRFKLKYAAIKHYSNGAMCCNYCGYKENIDALCLDHINNNGAEHRKQMSCSSRNGVSGTTIYERLKALGWIDGLQILCFNCNNIKELERKRNGIHSSVLISLVDKPTRWA